MKYFWVFTLIFLLSSCTAKLQSLKTDKDVHLDDGEGYLLMEINTEISLSRLYVSGPTRFSLSYRDLRKGSNYVLINLPAGEYEFIRAEMKDYYINISDDNLDWTFEIKPDAISYVGALQIEKIWDKKFYLELVNKSSMAQEFLESKFQNILNSKQVVYQGPGEDDFFEDIQKLRRKEAK